MLSQKHFIREEIAAYKKSLSQETVDDLSQKIGNRLVQTDLFQQAKCIAFYCAIENEVQTSELIEAWHPRKKIVLPVVTGATICFYPYTGKENLTKGAFGIMEPASDSLSASTPANSPLPILHSPLDLSIDLFIVPGIAFDYECNRMGRGKGYYDRYLSGIDKPAIGLCFDFQLFKHIPCEAHDKKMELVVTEKTIVSLAHQ